LQLLELFPVALVPSDSQSTSTDTPLAHIKFSNAKLIIAGEIRDLQQAHITLIAMSTSTTKLVELSFEAIDDLIYDARAGDLEALKADIATLASQHGCPESHIVASAIDMEAESEGGTGSCVLHFPAANGNIGMLFFTL
jgi:hypothetical protein